MSIFSALLLIAIALSMVITAILLVNALKNNFQTGELVRNQIAQTIDQLPFGQMLGKHGVDIPGFLHKVPLTEIDSEIRSCQSCTKTVECDRALQSDILERSDLGFCPNAQMIACSL